MRSARSTPASGGCRAKSRRKWPSTGPTTRSPSASSTCCGPWPPATRTDRRRPFADLGGDGKGPHAEHPVQAVRERPDPRGDERAETRDHRPALGPPRSGGTRPSRIWPPRPDPIVRCPGRAPDATLQRLRGLLPIHSGSAPRGRKTEDVMTQTLAASAALAADRTAIRPFKVESVPEAELAELRRRIEATRFPERETVADASQGVQLATMQSLARYWRTEYDWRRCERRLQALPNFITEIDGLDIHFIHVRSKHKGALPVIVTHGWPGSVVEQLKIVDPLTNPTAHGGNASDAFYVVSPSIPGYGYSGKPASTGWGAGRIGRAWIELMKRLGYKRFVAQGGDWGAVITDFMALERTPELIGIHTNMPGIFPAEIDQAAFSGAPAPSSLSADEKVAYERLQFVYQKGIAYGYQMGLRPQTLYGIADSPVGLAGYFLDHDARSYELISRVFAGASEGLTRDDILDNITITWLTNTGISGARLYWEYWGRGYFNAKGVSIPVAVGVFPAERFPAPRSWAGRAYPRLVYYKRHDKGGHFAAWEQPQLLSEDVRANSGIHPGALGGGPPGGRLERIEPDRIVIMRADGPREVLLPDQLNPRVSHV